MVSNFDFEERAAGLREKLNRSAWANSLAGIGLFLFLISFASMSDSFIWGSWEPWWLLDWSLFLSSIILIAGCAHSIGFWRDEELFRVSLRSEFPELTNYRGSWAIWAAALTLLSGFLFPNWWFPSSQYSYPVTDPRFDTCREAKSNGYGPYYRFADGEYEWYIDRDSDGIVCE